jgi:uncharacterized membrane protein YphA (DoxX/SURF4 family)
MKFHFSDSSVDIGILLFRVLMAYSLLDPVRLIAISFTSGFGATITLIEVFAFIAFCGGTIFLILGFHTKSTSLCILIFLLALHFAFQSAPFSILQIGFFLALFLIGPGKYSFDSRDHQAAALPVS